MIATGHQPAYMPWLGLIQKIAVADVFISWDDVPMESSGYENRNRILTSTGEQWISVPVRKAREAKIKDLIIANEHDWQRKHFRSIELAYKRAPFWGHYEPLLRWIYVEAKWERLCDLDEQLMTFLLKEFEITVGRLRLSAMGLTSSKGQLVLDACKHVKAWKYVFGEKGRDYADPTAFRAAGVEPMSQEYRAVPYQQINAGDRSGAMTFVPNLWAFDALLNLGPEKAREIMLAGGTVRRME